MIHLISFILMAGAGSTPLKAHDLFFASEDRLKQVVGPRTSPPKEPGIRFAHAGYYDVWVDSAGPGMSHIRLGLGSLVGWKSYLVQIGLGADHASVRPVPVAVSPIPLFRNKLSVSGATGLPKGKTGKPWNVTFVEYGVANKARLRQLKPQIKALPVGDARNALIRSCYDWWSELDLTAS